MIVPKRVSMVSVYPRVCGGTLYSSMNSLRCFGLSPRVRGNRAPRLQLRRSPRSIPACAGEPGRRSARRRQPGVYPRVCGGTPFTLHWIVAEMGLSPRVRGNRALGRDSSLLCRSIPACAGEPLSDLSRLFLPKVYPRVCGGTDLPLSDCPFPPGLSPRVRGNPRRRPESDSSPGSIPACAGEPFKCGKGFSQPGVYPRVCGGTAWLPVRPLSQHGLSPRVRGNPERLALDKDDPRSIPARAGEPPPRLPPQHSAWVYPRVCGGTASQSAGIQLDTGLSPRVRGNQPSSSHAVFNRGSIPACAGEPVGLASVRFPPRVYPRVCGGTSRRRAVTCGGRGLSPRVRGNRAGSMGSNTQGGSIPACAGEPTFFSLQSASQRVYPRVCGGTLRATLTLPTPTGLSPRVRGNRCGSRASGR